MAIPIFWKSWCQDQLPLNVTGSLGDRRWRTLETGSQWFWRSFFHHLSPLVSLPDHGSNSRCPWGTYTLLRMKSFRKMRMNYLMIENEKTLRQYYLSQIRWNLVQIQILKWNMKLSLNLHRALIACLFFRVKICITIYLHSFTALQGSKPWKPVAT